MKEIKYTYKFKYYKRRAKIRLSNLESTSDETFKEKSLV